MARIALGKLLGTPNALEVLREHGVNPGVLLARHARGDWGEVDAEDWALNDRAVGAKARILSAYRIPDGPTVWIITEADRSATTILLPEDY
jgi:hypothetical protein